MHLYSICDCLPVHPSVHLCLPVCPSICVCLSTAVNIRPVVKQPHQILGVVQPQVCHKTVLLERPLIDALYTGRLALLQLVVYVCLVLTQPWRIS